MLFRQIRQWLSRQSKSAKKPLRQAARNRNRARPAVEALEDRVVFATTPAGLTIEGISFDQSGILNLENYSIPPDPIGVAGPNHVVSVVNRSIEWHTKAGVQQNSQRLGSRGGTAVGSFFATLNPAERVFDPKVIYDQFAARFLVVALERTDTSLGDSTNTSRLLFAVSDDADPNGTWYFSAINSRLSIGGSDRWADYPGLAVDSQAIYLTANMFSFGSSPTFAASRLWILDKAPFYAGGTAAATVYDPSTAAGLSSQAFTLQPAHMFGTAPTGVGTFLVSSDWVSGSTDFLSVIRVHAPLGTPTFTNQFISLGDIHNSSAAFPDAPQAGTSTLLETNDVRALNAVWRNNQLYAVNTVVPPSGTDAGQATAHWYRINTATLSALALADQGNVGGEDIATGTHTFFPSIAVNGTGDVAIGFSASAASIYGSAYYTGRLTSDAAGTVRASRQLAPGLDYYVRTFGTGRNRWGDYTGTSVDPADDTTFWAFNEYALTRGTLLNNSPEDGRWGTRWASFTLPGGGSGNLIISAADTPGGANGASDGVADQFRLVRNGANLDVFINGSLFLAIPFTTVTAITVNGSSDNDTLTVDFANGTPIPSGGLTFDGSTGSDTLIVQGSSASEQFTQVNGSVSVSGVSANYTATVENVTVRGMEGDDSFTIQATGTSPIFSFEGAGGTDSYYLLGTTGADAFVRDLEQQVTRAGIIMKFDSTVEWVTASGLAGDDSFTIQATGTGPVFNFEGGDGTDSYYLLGTAGADAFVRDLNERVTRAGLIMNFNTTTVEWVTASGLAGDDSFTIQATGTGPVFNFEGGDGTDDRFFLQGTGGADAFVRDLNERVTRAGLVMNFNTTTVERVIAQGLAGDDSFTIQATGVGPIFSFEGGDGTDSYYLNGTSGNDTFIQTGSQVAWASVTAVYDSATEGVNVLGLGGDDSLTVNAYSSTTTLTFDGGVGTDSLTLVNPPSGTTRSGTSSGSYTLPSPYQPINFNAVETFSP